MHILPEQDLSLLDVARAYQSEYDAFRSSRSIEWVLSVRSKLGKAPYEPLGIERAFPPEKMWMRLAAKENRINRHFREHWASWAAQIPESHESAYYGSAPRPRVGIITDAFTYEYYEGALDLHYLYPDTFRQTIDENDLDFVLYVTCWHGRHDQEDYYYTNDEAGHARIRPALAYAREVGLPVVFQSIEDPPSYQDYLDLARMADFVFTSCAEKIDDYKKDLGHDRVFASKFGVNPLLNNPVGMGMRHIVTRNALENSVLFAGSWYPQFAERCADTQLIFDALIKEGKNLVIADRRWPLDWGACFPEAYWHYLVPNFQHRELQAATKLFDFAINLNSVKDSSTMCAMRTYELQAMGVIGIANDAQAVREQYPDLPRIANEEDLFHLFDDMDTARLFAMQRAGIRRVMSGDTVYDRLNLMFEQMGLDFRYPEHEIALLVGQEDAQAQHAASLLSKSIPHAKVILADKEAAYAAAQSSECRFALRVSGENPPTATFVADALNAFKYTDATFVGECSPESKARYSFVDALPAACPVLVDLSKASGLEPDSLHREDTRLFVIPRETAREATAS